jgi:uncharacterized membrane protein
VNAKFKGLIVGLVVGVLWMWLGFGEMLFVAIAAVVGYVIGGMLGGELDVQRFIDGLRRK